MNHCDECKKTWISWEPLQEWLGCQNYSKCTSTSHPGIFFFCYFCIAYQTGFKALHSKHCTLGRETKLKESFNDFGNLWIHFLLNGYKSGPLSWYFLWNKGTDMCRLSGRPACTYSIWPAVKWQIVWRPWC